MFEFEIDSSGNLSVLPSKILKERVAIRCAEVQSMLEKSLENSFKSSAKHSKILALHPAAQGLYAFKQGHVTKEHAGKLLEYLTRLPEERLRRLESNCLTVEQQQILIPEQDTRGARILVENDYPLDYLDQDFGALTETLGDEWRASLQVNTISFVNVPGMPDLPYFSGSTSDFWGAMHMTRPSSRYILAESVTHESSHFWVHCLEEISALSEHSWDNEVWVSAWREDPRPIGGVIHGVHVFSCIATVLTCLCMNETSVDEQTKQAQLARLAYVIAQVEDGISECERSGLLLEAGKEILRFSNSRLQAPQNYVDSALLTVMREQVFAKRVAKQKSWRQKGWVH